MVDSHDFNNKNNQTWYKQVLFDKRVEFRLMFLDLIVFLFFR